MQAEIARAAGRPTLARNFERAAELVDVPQDVILQLYELLRPGRAKDKAAAAGGGARLLRETYGRADGGLHRGSGAGLRAPRAVHQPVLSQSPCANT